MSKNTPVSARDRLISAATFLLRKRGFTGTSVEQICKETGVTKGAIFHHFKSKSAIAEACLQQRDQFGQQRDGQEIAALKTDSPVEKALGFMDRSIEQFRDPDLLKSCLAETVAQEIGDSEHVLRESTDKCFKNAELRFATLLDGACKHQGRQLDTASLASLWIATIQGSLTLGKASGDQEVVAQNLQQVKRYVAILLGIESVNPTTPNL